jgi:hypothetical protein
LRLGKPFQDVAPERVTELVTTGVPPARLTDQGLADVVEPRSVGLAFGLVDGAAYYGNSVLARGLRAQLVPVLRDAATAYLTTGQEPRPINHDPAPPLDGLLWTFAGARGAWFQGERCAGSGLDLLAVLHALV